MTDEKGDNIIATAEKAKELEKARKINSPYEESSERRQNVENSVNEIFKRLRQEKN